jgi:very-short-patch-repair endonuclease
MSINKLNKKLLPLAQTLRKTPTDAEQHLWNHLRNKQLFDLKFRRQQPMGHYIVDFVCFQKRIIIEVDGGQHAENKRKDTQRDSWLRQNGFKILHFWNNDILKNIDGVLEVIAQESIVHPPLTPPIKGGEKKTRKQN